MRCQNPARAGPFGGVVPVQMASGDNSTAKVVGKEGNRRAIEVMI